jgi:hypothetical protein
VAEVVTGEAVVLDVPGARFPSRLLALIVDLLIQGAEESPPGAGHHGPAAAWRELAGAAREGEPEHMPPAKGGGGFVPPA